MRGKLQYAYSISVFLGVLVSSYLMMERDKDGQIPGRTIAAPSYRADATAFDPGVNQLLEMENAISKLRKDRPDASKKRVPSDLDSERTRPEHTGE